MVHRSTPPAGHPSTVERPVQNPQLAPHSKPWWRSRHRALIHRRVKERHTDVPDSTHLPAVGVFARGQHKQHPQHLQWWRALMEIISVENIVLLHDSTTPDIGLVAIARLEVVTPPRSLNLGALGNVCFIDPIVDIMMVHVLALCQSALDHFLRIHQLGMAVLSPYRSDFSSAWHLHTPGMSVSGCCM